MKRHDLIWLLLAGLLFQGFWLLLLPTPAYMDAYYYTTNGQRLAEGHGWTEMVVWQYLDNPAGVPTPSHTYWMPLPSLFAAAGYTLTSSFRGAQLPFWLMTSLLPLLSYLISHKLGGERWQNIAAALFTLSGGFYLANWNQPETFAPFAWAGGGCLFLLAWAGQKNLNQRITPFLYGGVGVLAGLAHLTRADGVLLLAVAFLVVFINQWAVWAVRGETAGKQNLGKTSLLAPDMPLRRTFLGLGWILLGYLLVMLPWFSHNLRTTGQLLPTTGTQTLFLTTYDDLFAYGRTFSLSSYLEWGLGNILGAKARGMGNALQTFIAIGGLIFLTPFVLAGGWWYWRRGQNRWLRPLLLYTLALFAAMSLVFTFPGERGGLFHSSVALWPWFMALVPAGISWSVEGMARRLPHWQPARAKRLFTGLFIGVALVLGLVLGFTRGTTDVNARLYAQVGNSLPEEAVVMVGNAPAYYYFTHQPAYSLPNEPIETVLAAAARYHITHLILDENHPLPLAELYGGTLSHPALEQVTTLETIRVYQITNR